MLQSMSRRIVMLVYPGCQSLDVTGPFEVFHGADQRVQRRAGQPSAYQLLIASRDMQPVRTESGLRLVPDVTISELLSDDASTLDTLMVPGGSGVRDAVRDRELHGELRALSRRARRTASVCTGSFLLAASGLLDRRRATTHWAYCDELARSFPLVRVDAEPIYVRDDRFWTSAGVTAGIDLSLALVEDDLGPTLASKVARQLVVFVRRSAAQPQLSAQLSVQTAEHSSLRELVAWLSDHPEEDLRVHVLAKRCGMSGRNFARLFREQVGVTPARYVERVRTEHARRLLQQSNLSVDLVALRAGFPSADALRRALKLAVGASPAVYRRQNHAR